MSKNRDDSGGDAPSSSHPAHSEKRARGESNPFSTRYVRPGAVPYAYPAGENAETIIARLQKLDWWGQIVGPHGSGKSTLLAALVPALVAAGRQPISCTLRDEQRSLAEFSSPLAAAGPQTIVVVDGYEQLSYWSRWWLSRFCRRRGAGLLVTTHASAGFPTLVTTSVDESTALAVLSRLLPEGAPIQQSDLREALSRHAGNLREALFELYDLYELRRPSAP